MHEFCSWSKISKAGSRVKSVKPSRQDLMTPDMALFADLIWDEFAVVFRQCLLIP